MNATGLTTAFAVFLMFQPVLPATAGGVADAPPGATSCSGCHAATRTADTTVPRLIGRAPGDIVALLIEFKTGKRTATVMDRLAKGFTDDEMKAIAEWYGSQKD